VKTACKPFCFHKCNLHRYVEMHVSEVVRRRRREGARRRSEAGISPPTSFASPREPTIVEVGGEKQEDTEDTEDTSSFLPSAFVAFTFPRMHDGDFNYFNNNQQSINKLNPRGVALRGTTPRRTSSSCCRRPLPRGALYMCHAPRCHMSPLV
jgi:hypothetical protein